MTVGKALLCTLGPSSLTRPIISQLEEVGVTAFRINLSHTDSKDLGRIVQFIQSCTTVPICIDTEGAQIRTGAMSDGVIVREGSRVQLVPERVHGDASTIPLTPADAIGRLTPSATMSVDFDSVVLRVDRVWNGVAEATVLAGGEIGSRKAVTAHPSPRLQAFSDKDRAAIEYAARHGIRHFALSFCEHPTAVHRLRDMTGPDSTVIAKIESREGVRNLGAIASVADAILIDRGDLSREVRLEAIPFLQKAIIRKANAWGIPVYVATNLLESMVARRAPTRAEVNDVMNTLLDGADGLVLAAETAVGQHPVEAARMIMSLLNEFESSRDGYPLEGLLGPHPLAPDRLPAEEPVAPKAGLSAAPMPPDRRRALRKAGAV
jgi:sulfate adenylyltransferase